MAAGLATVFQDPALIPDLTVEQNFRLTGIEERSVRAWLDRMSVADLDFDTLIRELPLELLRLLDLSRALANDPQLLLLDEITAALPADQAEHVFSVMREWKDRGRSVLFITHRLAEVLRMCDRATILRDGRNVASVIPGERGEGRLLEAMLGEVRPTPRSSSRPVRTDRQRGTGDAGGTRLRSGDQVNGISFQLRAGEILGIAALEGQGQDRLFDLLAGDRRPDSGRGVGRRKTAVGAISLRRHPAGSGAGALRSAAGLACRSARCGRTWPFPSTTEYGRWLSLVGDEEERADQSHCPAVDRHQGAAAGPSAFRWQPAEGGDRPLAGNRLSNLALLRPHQRDRYPDQAADLRPVARDRRYRRCGAHLHERTARDSPGVRPGAGSVQRAGGPRAGGATATEEGLLSAAHGLGQTA